MTLDPVRTFCRLLLVEKAGGGPAWEGGGGRADNAGQLVLVAYICSIVDRGAVMHYGVKQEGGPVQADICNEENITERYSIL